MKNEVGFMILVLIDNLLSIFKLKSKPIPSSYQIGGSKTENDTCLEVEKAD